MIGGMDILFITSTRLGDAILSLGVFEHIVRSAPGARITVVCGSLPAPLFENVPGVETIIPLKKKSWNRHWVDLWARLRGTSWDTVVDLRDTAVSRLVPARRRFVYNHRIDKTLHKVLQNASVMQISPAPAPRIRVSAEHKRRAAELLPPGGPIIGLGPTANWSGKIWPPGCFIELAERLTDPHHGVLPRARLAVFAAPGEEYLAQDVVAGLPQALRIDLSGKTDVMTAAACLERCALYVGNDSGLMHMAAALEVPTVGLFGPGWPAIYGPWGVRTAIARTPQSREALIAPLKGNLEGAPCLMGDLSVESVCQAVSRVLSDRPVCALPQYDTQMPYGSFHR